MGLEGNESLEENKRLEEENKRLRRQNEQLIKTIEFIIKEGDPKNIGLLKIYAKAFESDRLQGELNESIKMLLSFYERMIRAEEERKKLGIANGALITAMGAANAQENVAEILASMGRNPDGTPKDL